MKKIILSVVLVAGFLISNAQETPAPKKKKSWAGLDVSPKDHLLLQYGVHSWKQKPDSINTGGFSRSFNLYFMYDMPFKTNPQFSVGVGLGVGSDNVFFKKTNVDLKSRDRLYFNKDTVTSYKKYKLTTAFLQAPVELRFTKDPTNPGKSFKAALGVTVGTMINAHTKAKVNRDANNQGGYINKINDRTHFNNLRFAATGRIGFGLVSLFASYQLNQFFKEGAGPADIRPMTIGITLSGL
jgi:hypothetical protein